MRAPRIAFDPKQEEIELKLLKVIALSFLSLTMLPSTGFSFDHGANPNASRGLERAESRAQPGDDSLSDTIGADAGRGNGPEESGDPGRSGTDNPGSKGSNQGGG
jgi:hypothetical protein